MGGARSAFDEAVPPLLPRMRRAARQFLANPALAEEAVQEALLRAYRFWGRRRRAQVWPWLRTLVIRECLRASARDAAQRRAGPVEGPADSPGDIAVRREEHAEVRRAIEVVPAGYRRVLVLHHGRGLTEAEIAAVLGLPLGTVKWRIKRAHDHLRQVLTRQVTRPLTETLREVAKQMPLEIGLSVGSLPKDPPDWPDPKVMDAAPPLVTLAEAQANVPAFQVPPSMVRQGKCARVRRNDDGSPRGVQYDVDGGGFDGSSGWTIVYTIQPRGQGMHINMPFARRIAVNEPTRVGDHAGHWWTVDETHMVLWYAAGGLWYVNGQLAAAEIRRLAEEIAGLQPPEPEEPAPPPTAPRTPPPPISAAEARRLLPGFALSDVFLKRHSAKILPMHRSGGPAPDGLQVYGNGFVVSYIPPGSQPIRVLGFEMLRDHTPVGGREAIWWRSTDSRAVSWPAADGGRWRVDSHLGPDDLRRIAEEVVSAAGEPTD